MLSSFKCLKTFQLAEYIILALFAFTIPFSWHISTYVMIALFVATILKGVFENGFKPNPAQYRNKVAYILFISFWVIYAVSFLYSDNSAEARIQIGKKLSFLLFPLFFLCSNLSYLTKDRIRLIIYSLILGVFMLFFINFVWACIDILFNDNNIERIISPHKFFKTNDSVILPYIHRGYFSIMSCMALAFSISELFINKSKIMKTFNVLSIIAFTFIPFFITSRAGILCVILTLSTAWFWIMFIKKEKKIGYISGITIAVILAAGYFVFPKSIDRFTKTFDNLKEGKGDCRLTIRNANRYIISEHFMFGVGSGDRSDETLKSYHRYKDEIIASMKPTENIDIILFESSKKVLLDSIHQKFENKYTDEVYEYIDSMAAVQNCNYSSVKDNLAEYQITKHCIKYELNAHNQYTDTLISVGIIGLILLIGFFIIPVSLIVKNRNFDLLIFSLIVIIAFNSFFESLFERQMGIMFFTFFYFLLFHAAFCQNGKTENKTLRGLL